MLRILERLIAFETVTAASNLDMIDYIEATCTALGAVCTRVKGSSDNRIGLVARLGPNVPGGVILSGHCDVVPVTGQKWTRPAFKLTRDRDHLYGRGTTDMKGFLACMLDAAQTAARGTLAKPLTLVFSYDEEIGCIGIQEMKAALPPLLGDPRLCIVGEPTQMKIATGHKGKVALHASFNGQAGHSAMAPNFVNALHVATDFVRALGQLQQWYTRHGAHDRAYDVPYSTIHVGTLRGGTSLNIVPDAAEMTWEYRYLPADGDDTLMQSIQQTAKKVVESYRARFPETEIAIERSNSYPGLDVDQNARAVRSAQAWSDDPALTKVAYGTEAGVFADLGIPTIVCGPGSMQDQGHKPDEFIALDQLQSCAAMLKNAVEALR